MTATGGRRAAAAAALAALLLCGCGVPETDVVEAGAPADFEVEAHPSTGLLFFRSPDGGLTPVIRFLEEVVDVPEQLKKSTPRTVAALFAGPSESERAAGLTDGLPDLPETPVRLEPHPENGVVAVLPIPVDALDERALQQIVCTVAFSEEPEGAELVHLRGSDTALKPDTCRENVRGR